MPKDYTTPYDYQGYYGFEHYHKPSSHYPKDIQYQYKDLLPGDPNSLLSQKLCVNTNPRKVEEGGTRTPISLDIDLPSTDYIS